LKATIQRLRHDDPHAELDAADLVRTPQQRFADAERLIALAFAMRGEDGRVDKRVTRVLRRERGDP
jgi:hypothetical protein